MSQSLCPSWQQRHVPRKDRDSVTRTVPGPAAVTLRLRLIVESVRVAARRHVRPVTVRAGGPGGGRAHPAPVSRPPATPVTPSHSGSHPPGAPAWDSDGEGIRRRGGSQHRPGRAPGALEGRAWLGPQPGAGAHPHAADTGPPGRLPVPALSESCPRPAGAGSPARRPARRPDRLRSEALPVASRRRRRGAADAPRACLY